MTIDTIPVGDALARDLGVNSRRPYYEFNLKLVAALLVDMLV